MKVAKYSKFALMKVNAFAVMTNVLIVAKCADHSTHVLSVQQRILDSAMKTNNAWVTPVFVIQLYARAANQCVLRWVHALSVYKTLIVMNLSKCAIVMHVLAFNLNAKKSTPTPTVLEASVYNVGKALTALLLTKCVLEDFVYVTMTTVLEIPFVKQKIQDLAFNAEPLLSIVIRDSRVMKELAKQNVLCNAALAMTAQLMEKCVLVTFVFAWMMSVKLQVRYASQMA